MSKMAEKDYEIQQTDTDGTEGVVDLEKEMKPKKKKKISVEELLTMNENNTSLIKDCIAVLKDYKTWLDDVDDQLTKIKHRLGL